MKDIIVIDDLVSIERQDWIEETMLGIHFPWYYYPGYVRPNDGEDRGVYANRKMDNDLVTFNGQQFNHIFYSDNQVQSDLYHGIVEQILQAIPLASARTIRAKGNLVIPEPGATERSTGMPHIDHLSEKDAMIALYYVNDSDGDTIIFNETPEDKVSWLTEKKVVSPKKGRVVIFSNKYIHGSGIPIKNKSRCVVNINFIPWNGGMTHD